MSASSTAQSESNERPSIARAKKLKQAKPVEAAARKSSGSAKVKRGATVPGTASNGGERDRSTGTARTKSLSPTPKGAPLIMAKVPKKAAAKPSRSKMLTTKAVFETSEPNGYYQDNILEALKAHPPEGLVADMRVAVVKCLTFRCEGARYGNIDALLASEEVRQLADQVSAIINRIPHRFRHPIRPLTPKFIRSILSCKFNCLRTKTLWTVEYDKEMPDEIDCDDMDFGYSPFDKYYL